MAVTLAVCMFPGSATLARPSGAAVPQEAPGVRELVAEARGAAEAGDWERARALLQRARLLDAVDPRLDLELGIALERTGEPVAAMEAYRRAWEKAPDLVAAAENLAALLRRRGSLDEAEHVIREALRERPEAGSLHYHLALILFDRDQRLTEPAVGALARARELGFRQPHLFLLLARVARHSGESAKAETLAREGLELAPEDPGLAHELGMALAARGRPAAAVPWLRRAARGSPDDVGLAEDLAMVQLRAGDAAGAATFLERSLREHPDAPELLYLLARAQREIGDPDAETTMRRFEERQAEARARRSAGERAMAEVREGVERWGEGRLDEAAARFRAALEERPGWIPAKGYLAAALLELGRVEEARALAGEIRETDPDNAQALLVLGRSALEEDPRRAVELLEEAVALYPYRVVCLLSLAEAYLARGRREDAGRLLDRAEGVEPDNAWLQALLSRVRSPGSEGSPEAFSAAGRSADVWTT